MLISASGSWLSDITEDQVAICRIKDGVCINDKKPSIELGFHQAVLNERREGKLIGVISHVAALKERIACQLEVVPGTGGRSVVQGAGVRRVE